MLDRDTVMMTYRKVSNSKNNGEAFQRCLKRVKQMSEEGGNGIENEKLLKTIDRYLKLKDGEKRHKNSRDIMNSDQEIK